MFVRLVGMLQTLTKSASTIHKHSLRQHMNLPVATNTPPTTQQNTQQPTQTTQQNLLHSVVTFLGSCARRKNSPLLRDALRSVVGILILRLLYHHHLTTPFDTSIDTLDLLALDKEMHADAAVNLELDKAVSLSTYSCMFVNLLSVSSYVSIMSFCDSERYGPLLWLAD